MTEKRRDVIDRAAKTVLDSMRLGGKTFPEVGKVITYRGKKVRIVEEATGFVSGPKRYWVSALEPVAGYAEGEEFCVSGEHVRRQLCRKSAGRR
jgi:hypothetical protein